MHKKHSTTFVRGHPFSLCVSYDQFFNPLPLCAFRLTVTAVGLSKKILLNTITRIEQYDPNATGE